MDVRLLDVLRCQFCGRRLTLVDDGASLVRVGDDIDWGVLFCDCCAFPIVDGIPVLVCADEPTAAVRHLEAGRRDDALLLMLGLDGSRAEAFRVLLARGDEMTYRAALRILSVDAEGEYFVYRFSDPTYLVAQAMLRCLGTNPRLVRRTIDVCGGSGHLTRVLAAMSPPGQAFLADLYFWKLWLARRFTAPSCVPVCCDANQPLPFARDTFSLVVCSDAFPYIWQRRLLADEMMRLAGGDGVVVMPHLHSALGENYTAGMTLPPAAYQDLLAPHGARLFRDSELLDQVLDRRVVDLAHDHAAATLAGEPALAIVASRHDEVYRVYDMAQAAPPPAGEVIVNPLYRVERRDGASVLTLTFPTPEYEDEFRAAKRYLPASVTVRGDLTTPIDPRALGADYATLRERLVLIDAPPRYC
jgi:uncharacterized protein YbaR (Trm112 family)